jgi:hypothetical protein
MLSSARALGVWLTTSSSVSCGRWSLGIPDSLPWSYFRSLSLFTTSGESR